MIENTEREAFEALASRRLDWNPTGIWWDRSGNDYADRELSLMWLAWQAARSLPATPESEALHAIIRVAEAAKEPCGSDPESTAAIRNGKFATIAQMAAQGLGLVRGPSLAAQPSQAEPAAQPVEARLTDEQIEAAAKAAYQVYWGENYPGNDWDGRLEVSKDLWRKVALAARSSTSQISAPAEACPACGSDDCKVITEYRCAACNESFYQLLGKATSQDISAPAAEVPMPEPFFHDSKGYTVDQLRDYGDARERAALQAQVGEQE